MARLQRRGKAPPRNDKATTNMINSTGQILKQVQDDTKRGVDKK